MFGLFKKKDPAEKLSKEYKELMQKAFDLSKTDRTASDALYAKADELMKRIEALKSAAK